MPLTRAEQAVGRDWLSAANLGKPSAVHWCLLNANGPLQVQSGLLQERDRSTTGGLDRPRRLVAAAPIGSIRRECLDHVVILDEMYLRRVFKTYTGYYNGAIETELCEES